MTSPAGTPVQRLAGLILGCDVLDWVVEKRGTGPVPDRTLRQLARELHEATGGQVDVTPETIRLWLAEADAGPEKAAS